MNWDRVRLARRWGRGLLAIGVLAVLLGIFAVVAAPAFTEPTFYIDRTTFFGTPSALLVAIGFGGMFFGLALMWRIYRAPTKHESASWRYRDRD